MSHPDDDPRRLDHLCRRDTLRVRRVSAGSAGSLSWEHTCLNNTVFNPSTHTCGQCAENQFANAERCEECPAGSGPDLQSQTCALCKEGKFSTSGVCRDCSAGKFSSGTGVEECTSCAAGKFAQLTAATSCQECEAGSYAERLNSTSCTLCEPGFLI